MRPEAIPARAVAPFLAGCRRRGVDPAEVLAAIGEPRSLLVDPNALFPVRKIHALVLAISTATNDESLGFLDRAIRPGGLELSVHATITSKTVGEAMARWNLFWDLAHDYEFCAVRVEGDEAKLRAEFPMDDGVDRSLFITWTALFVLRWSSWLIGKPILLDRIYFPFEEPDDLDDFLGMFPCRHYFGQHRVTAVFNRRFLDMPVVQTAETVGEFIEMIPKLMTAERIDRSLTARIKRMLHTSSDSIDALPLKVIADHLQTSQDTIRRQLKREGISYAEIKESVRRDLAVYHLRGRDTPITEIAKIVGFSEPSGFSRAFKKWTGQTPGEYRAEGHEPMPAQGD
ncbi:MAG: AraC family transcriptional regulator ligand-binding domain-containing protein [Myxococcota bacterium]